MVPPPAADEPGPRVRRAIMSFRSSSLREHGRRDRPRAGSHRRALGGAHAVRRRCVLARARRRPSGRRRLGGGRRGVGPLGLRAEQQRRRDGHRRRRREDRGRPRARRRPGQPRAARPQGPVRVEGDGVPRPPHPPAGPPRRGARAGDLGRGDGPGGGALAGAARRARRLGAVRLLHQRPALPGGVLHARRDREGGHRDAAHGRQHPPVHGDRRRRAEGELRHRRTAGLLHGRGPLRRDRAVGPQRGGDPDGPLVADARSAPRARPAADAGR